ncbi:MAG: hypothetical protein IRY99_18990 [Isosphaeraceae bacterium]|nr:hypothetical protein [Isosphaeraceae bacterium]
MGEEQVAIIRRTLDERDEAETSPSPAPGEYCASFEVPPAREPWLQATGGVVHFHYPFAEEPSDRLSRLGLLDLPAMECLAWESGQYATFAFERVPNEVLARWIDRLFTTLYEGGASYELEASVQIL